MFKRTLVWALCGAFALSPTLASAQSPIRAFPPGTFQNRAALDAAPTASYQGPGDIVSGALIWGSCARVYNTSLASTSTSLCDLVDITTGAAIGTLRGSTTGFVDLSAYFAGTVTPATACVGGCRVSKVYDQIGGTSGWIQATNALRPVLTFSALSGLPGWTCTAAAISLMATSSTFTQASPYTWVVVGERTANFTTEQALIGWSSSPNGGIRFTTSANTVTVDSVGATGGPTLGSVADSSFHAIQGVINSTTTGVLAVDGTEQTGTTGTTGSSASPSRICRSAPGGSLDGKMMEAGLWPSAISSGDRTSLNSNMHGTSGYNF